MYAEEIDEAVCHAGGEDLLHGSCGANGHGAAGVGPKSWQVPQLFVTFLALVSFFVLGGLIGVLGPAIPSLALVLGG
jgi:hypothetical protein